jgi:Mce-associated membrane protein
MTTTAHPTGPADETQAPGPGPSRGRTVATAPLSVVAVLLAAACVVVLIWPTAVPGRTKAEKADDRDLAVNVAATTVTKAFLDVNYKDMDPGIAKVLKMSTGTFKSQYNNAKVNLKAAAQQAQTVATGSVRYVGIGDIDDNAAVVFVAADADVTNVAVEAAKKNDKKETGRRYYRFQLNLSKVHGHWLLDDLQFIS